MWTVLGAVDQMDLDAFYGAYRANGQGRAAYDPQMMGWIQPVVATPDVEELSWRGITGRGIVPLQPERVGVDIRLRGVGSIGSGSGRRSREVPQAKTLRSRRECCRALVSGGFARVAACRLSPSRRCLGVICLSPSERRSQCCSPAVAGCERSPVSSVVPRRRSLESCNATRRSDAAELNIEPRPPTGMRSVAPGDPSRPSSRSTRSCGPMCRTGLSGTVQRPDGSVAGPDIAWRGRRQGPRKDRRWGQCWSPEQISGSSPPGLPR